MTNAMNCPECEELILESLETPLPEQASAGVRAHVGVCPSCRRFQQGQVRLDAALAKSLRPAKLAPDFAARLLEQVDRDLARTAPASVAARKVSAEAEFRAAMTTLEQGAPGSRMLRVLDLIGLGASGLLVGLLASSLLPHLASLHWPSVPNASPASIRYMAWAAGGLIAAAGLALGRRRDLLARLRV